MHYYTAYGLSFSSEVELPGYSKIPESSTAVSIVLNNSPESIPSETRHTSIFKTEDGIGIHWPGVAFYEICNGRKISICPEEGHRPEPKVLTQPLYGIVLAAILQQRELLVLHGSTVEIGNRALTIIGQKGFGKSTLSGSLLSRGHHLLSDDVTAVSTRSPAPAHVLPGIARLKLRTDAAIAIGYDPDSLPLISPSIPKHILFVPEQFQSSSTILHTIVMLDTGDTIAIHDMTEAEKMIWLSGGQYFSHYHHALDHRIHKHIFRCNSELVRTLRIIRLTMPIDINSLPLTTDLLERYLLEAE